MNNTSRVLPVAPQLSQGGNSGNLFVVPDGGQDGKPLILVVHPPSQPIITSQNRNQQSASQNRNQQSTSQTQNQRVIQLRKEVMHVQILNILSALVLCGFGIFFATLGSLAWICAIAFAPALIIMLWSIVGLITRSSENDAEPNCFNNRVLSFLLLIVGWLLIIAAGIFTILYLFIRAL